MTRKAVIATASAFEAFGKVFKTPTGPPTAKAAEFSFWSNVISYSIPGETEVGWCTVYRDGEVIVHSVEQHLRTPEVLIPVDGPFVLPVIRESSNLAGLEAFRVEVGEAVVI